MTKTATTQAPHKVNVYIGPEIGSYGFGQGHPFGPHRMDVFWSEAQRQGLDQQVAVRQPVLASREEIQRFHHADYVDQVIRQSESGHGFLDHGDTPAYKGVYQAAAHVVGSTLDGVHRIMGQACRRVFVPIAGLHHARPERAGGFCVFNDCGIVIATLRSCYQVRKVAYVDIDAHHGDGVFYAFEADPDLYFADTHEDGRYLYPGTGAAEETGKGAAVGRKMNIPLPPFADDHLFFQVWEGIEAFLRRGAPEFILLQCGADSIADDPIAHLRFSPEAHGHAAQRLCLLAEELGHGRVLAVGGGGYNSRNIGRGWCAVVRAMLTVPAPEPFI